jgi:TatD DNase family protein
MIDSHAHLTDEKFAEEVEAVVARAREAGVEATVTVGTDLTDSAAAVEIAARYPDVFATVGIHPHAASTADEAALSRIRELAAAPRVVAIGETGLDYHYDFSPREAQRAAFAAQLRLAADLGLPVVVHAREADADLEAMLREHGRDVRGVLHSFSSGADLLRTALELGWYASFAGMVTFKNYDGAELLRSVPADRLLVETDSPYLTPVPHRGKRNEPCRVRLVAARAAELRGETLAALDAATTRNARRFYALPER